MTKKTNCLILSQYRTESHYNDFIGKYYHFPGGNNKSYLSLFKDLPIEFLYYEPEKNGKGEFFGYGVITKPPFEDNREKDYYFVQIQEYNSFSKPVYFKDEQNKIIEKEYSPEYYNAQNSVRKTIPKFIENICLDGGIILNFKADAHLLRVLGEELIATEKIGILELIKNSYDARATYCNIYIEKVAGLMELPQSSYAFNDYVGPVIVIEDDGIGMDKEVIANGWLRPASTIKTNLKEKLKRERQFAIENGNIGIYESLIASLKNENGGRLPVGEKGVGRFATRRLGRKLLLKTKIKNNDYEYLLEIDWDKFDHIADDGYTNLDSIGVHLSRGNPSRDYGENNCGTQLIIYGGRPGFELNEKLIRDINLMILQMKSPNQGPNNFDVTLLCPQLPNLENKLLSEEFEPNFTLTGLVDEMGKCDFDFAFIPPNSIPLPEQKYSIKDYDLRASQKNDWEGENNEFRIPQCGQFYINLNVWYRKRPWIEGPKESLFKKYLEDFGGITIYRDGLNVFSSDVGAKVDWLNLSTRHIMRGEHLSYYNIIGSIELDQTSNVNLIDKTNREGMLNNIAFSDLSKLTRSIVLYIENQFEGKRDEFGKLSGDILKEPHKVGEVSKQAAIILQNVVNKYDMIKDPSNILQNLGKGVIAKERLIDLTSSLKKLEKSLKAMQHVQELLTEEAGFGLAVAISLHEITKLTTNFYDKVLIIANGGNLSYDHRENLKVSLASLREELRRLSPLRALRNEAKQEFNIIKSIKFVSEVFRKKLEKNKINLIIEPTEGFSVYCRYGALNQIFSNLVDNSIYWLDATKTKNRIIQIRLDQINRMIVFGDSNGDIDDSILPYIFEPGYSLKDPPSGLGLYICKYYIFDMKGNIYIAPNKERIENLSGAQFVLDFSKTPNRKEVLK
jgi:hypothetical protein